MNRTPRMILAALAIGLGTPPAQLLAQEVVIPASLAEAQHGKFMCWAAASMTAYKIVVANEGIGPNLITPTQRLLGIYNVAHDEQEAFGPSFNITALTTGDIRAAGARRTILRNLRNRTCPPNATALGQCDHTGVPILQDLESTATAASKPLRFCQIRALMTAQRPVIFQWKGLVAPVQSANGRKKGPEGDHYMVILGARVRLGVPEVRVWDPWGKTQHLQWIPYTEYAQPSVAHGVPGEKHGVDYYQIRRPGRPQTSLPTRCDVNIPVLAPVVLAPRPLDEIRRDFLPANIRQTLQSAQLPPLEAGQRYGYAFPIVALTSAQIVAGSDDPSRLIRSESAAVLVAVEDASGRFETLYSVLHDRQGWQRRGYVGSGVAAQLAETRKAHFDREPEQRPRAISDYYMLSIPSRRTFFAAYQDPRSNETMLVPVADDPAIGAYAGKSQPARDLLLRMATDIEADWARQARSRRNLRVTPP